MTYVVTETIMVDKCRNYNIICSLLIPIFMNIETTMADAVQWHQYILIVETSTMDVVHWYQ